MCTGFLSRARGMLLTSAEQMRGAWVVLEPCSAVHTLGMRYPIDILFLDGDGKVMASHFSVMPGRMRLGCRGARAAIERVTGGEGERWPSVGDRAPIGRASSPYSASGGIQ